jgi:hypothetical protein
VSTGPLSAVDFVVPILRVLLVPLVCSSFNLYATPFLIFL